MIVSENVIIEAELPTDIIFIEEELRLRGIEPLRWAVIAVNSGMLTVSVSYEK